MITQASPINLFDFEALARERMAAVDSDYVAGGATDEVTLRRTRQAYEAIALRPRVLAGVDRVDLSTTVLGAPVSLPVMLAPCGNHSLVPSRRRVGLRPGGGVRRHPDDRRFPRQLHPGRGRRRRPLAPYGSRHTSSGTGA